MAPSRGVDWRLAWAVWMRNFTVYRRTWTLNILPNFFEPLLYLVGMGLGVGFYVREGMNGVSTYLAFIAPGLMAASAMNGASFEVTYNMFVKLHFAKTYDAFLSTPVQIEDIVMGELLWAVTRALIYGLAFLVILAGFTLAGTPMLSGPGALALPLALALIGTLFALIGQLFTSKVNTIDLYSYYFTLWLSPLFIFSNVFFPVDRFPYGAQIAWFTPLYHGVRLTRGLAQSRFGTEELVSAAWMIAVCAALLWIVPRTYRRRIIR
ncbi:MAG: ABC transporter permease [Planctomycetes bacterium]|nr:ABC transporter permease [Planctomycetota bacterium]